MKRELKESTKKPYETPKLSVYGDVREITRTVGFMGAMDGGGGKGNPDMTQL